MLELVGVEVRTHDMPANGIARRDDPSPVLSWTFDGEVERISSLRPPGNLNGVSIVTGNETPLVAWSR